MSRRLPASLLLSALLSWVGIVLVCGATWRMQAASECTAALETAGCCKEAPVEAGCTPEACGLTCATLLLAQIAEPDVALPPDTSSLRLVADDQFGSPARARPLLPPPRA